MKREKPSTKARREGYRQLHKLGSFLFKILYPHFVKVGRIYYDDDDHWLEMEFDKEGWRDYMIRHTPELKRGGSPIKRPSKRKRRKERERRSTIR